MALRPTFDPDVIGFCEAAGWAAYYDRNWPRVLWLMVRLNRAQFGMAWLRAVAAALDTVRAAVAFAPVDHDLATTRQHLERFYARARRTTGVRADAATLAALELDYWVIHRELANRRKANHADDNLTPLIDALAALHAALFDSTPEQMRVSAVYRALAATAVDRITGGYSNNIAADWRQVHHLVCETYRAVRVTDRWSAGAQPGRGVAV